MTRLKETVKQKLIKKAEKYKPNEMYRFVSEIGWEDWMEEFKEVNEFEAIAEDIFIYAHLEKCYELNDKPLIITAIFGNKVYGAEFETDEHGKKHPIKNTETLLTSSK